MSQTTRPVALIPACVGSLLWAGASALLCEDAYRSGHWTVTTALQPVLTASAVASAVWVHRSISEWRPVRALGFALLAILASIACIWGTMGKLAEQQDTRSGDAMRQNRTLSEKLGELGAAKRGAASECGKIGPRCTQWQSRVDALTREASSLQLVSEDPRADALGRLAELLGGDKRKVTAIAVAVSPLLLPLTLELGSVLFWAAAFGRARVQASRKCEESVSASEVSGHLGRHSNQRELARAWGVHESTVSRRLRAMEVAGSVTRLRDGRCKLALPSPR